MTKPVTLRMCAASLVAGLSLLLTGCFISPGKFTSELVISEDESFTFTYEGEIFFLGMSRLAQLGAGTEEFVATECFDEETFEARNCTEEELAQQRAEWDAGAEERAAKAKKDAEQLAAITGGIDPKDPQAAEELRQLLLRHHGWSRVESKGDGLFDVTYSVSGKLSHDFMFPVIEKMPVTNPFVQVILREGKTVRVNAPGFAVQDGGNPMSGMMGGMAGLGALMQMGEEGEAAESEVGPDAGRIPGIPPLQGTFTITTRGNMNIRANNTDEGPTATTTGQSLSWKITPNTTAAPTALIAISE